MKNIRFFFLSQMFRFLEVKFSIYLNRRVFVMYWVFPVLYMVNNILELSYECFRFWLFCLDYVIVTPYFICVHLSIIQADSQTSHLIESPLMRMCKSNLSSFCFRWSSVLSCRTSMVRISLGRWKFVPARWKFVRDMGSSSHWRLIIALGQEVNGDNLGMPFRSSIE